MSTSTEIKKKYIKKNYTRWVLNLRNSDFEKIEGVRAKLGLSRADFLKNMVNTLYEIKFDEKGEFKKKIKYVVLRKNIKEFRNDNWEYYTRTPFATLEEAEIEYFKQDNDNMYTFLYSELWDIENDKLLKTNIEKQREKCKIALGIEE